MILVRHAMPEVVPGVAPDLWELGPDGLAAARALAARLDGGQIVSSDEPKARQTAEEIVAVCGGALTLTEGLREVARPIAWDDAYRDNARRYLAGARLKGWERAKRSPRGSPRPRTETSS